MFAVEDVLAEYEGNARPKTGGIFFEDNYISAIHQDEIRMAQWIHRTLGGDIVLLNERNEDKKKTPDYLWKGKCWDLKRVSSEKAVDSAIRNGWKQIAQNAGGLILEFTGDHAEKELLVRKIGNRVYRSAKADVDILVIYRSELWLALRYKIKSKGKPPRQ